MRRPALLVLLIAIAATAFLVGRQWRRSDAPVPGDDPTAAGDPGVDPAAESASPGPGERRLAPIGPDEHVPGAQGFTGRVVDADLVPLEGAVVDVVEAAADDLLSAALLAERSFDVPPAGTTTTTTDGRFRLPIRNPTPRGYELRVRHPRHPARELGPLTVFPDTFHELGDIDLPRGARVVGQVVIADGAGLPVPGAELRLMSTRMGASVTALAPRQSPWTATSDAAGRFTFEAALPGPAALEVAADGYARRVVTGIVLETGAPNRIDVALAPARPIEGRVTDGRGLPLPNAKVEALAIGAGVVLRSDARTDDDGRYRIDGLAEGPHRVTARAPGHVEVGRQPIEAGSTGVDFALAALPPLRIFALGPDGTPVTTFDVELRGIDDERDVLHGLPGARLERVTPDRLDADGAFVHPGLRLERGSRGQPDDQGALAQPGVRTGRFVVEVRAPGFARSFSPPFSYANGETTDPLPPRTVTVRLTPGGRVAALVQDVDGAPIADARITTHPADAPAWRPGEHAPLPGARVPRTSDALARTGADGRATLTTLAPGRYRLHAVAPGLCDAVSAPFEVTDGANADPVELTLAPGCLVIGSVRVDGAPAGQVKVSLVRVDPPPDDPGAPTAFADAVTGPDGRYAFDRPLPPGRYDARAYRLSLSNPLDRIVDQKRSLQVVDLGRSQDRHEVHFALEGS